MSKDRHIETFHTEWNSIGIQITWEPSWLNLGDCLGHDMGHLQVESTAPERTPLPITETGHRSHFTARKPSHRSAAPSPSSSPGSTRKASRQRRAREQASRQPSLF